MNARKAIFRPTPAKAQEASLVKANASVEYFPVSTVANRKQEQQGRS